jgi:molecular chaperone DnaK (HSP70)
MDGEDPELYEALLAKVAAAVQPMDFIDWLLLKDVVALTWEIQRARWHRASLITRGRRHAMERILLSVLPKARAAEAAHYAERWRKGDKAAIKKVESLLEKFGLSILDVSAQALSTQSGELDRIDLQTLRHETRRDTILKQIERRRLGWSGQVRRASDEIVDAEFRETDPDAIGARDGIVDVES